MRFFLQKKVLSFLINQETSKEGLILYQNKIQIKIWDHGISTLFSLADVWKGGVGLDTYLQKYREKKLILD